MILFEVRLISMKALYEIRGSQEVKINYIFSASLNLTDHQFFNAKNSFAKMQE